jgi:hypothetical protein
MNTKLVNRIEFALTIGDTGDVLVSMFLMSPLHYLNKDKRILIK